jgi:predicted RNA-binding protein with PIN domain
VGEETTVLVDGRNVQRSQWPNLSDEELVDQTRGWAERHGRRVVVVFDGRALGGLVGRRELDERTTIVGTGGESADDWLIREAPNHPGAWLVTSDRALREAVSSHASKVVGGGSFLRGLGD